MKKLLISILFIFAAYFLFSEEILKIKDIRAKISTLTNEEIPEFMKGIIDNKIEKETGWIINVAKYDDANDMVLVELDRTNMKNLVPDLSFVIDRKISRRLSEFQMLYFNATIKNYDADKKILEVSDVFLSGIMK